MFQRSEIQSSAFFVYIDGFFWLCPLPPTRYTIHFMSEIIPLIKFMWVRKWMQQKKKKHILLRLQIHSYFLIPANKVKTKKKKKRNRELRVCLTTLVWKDYINLLLPWMLMQMQKKKKKLYPLTLEIFAICYFKVPPAWLRADHTHMRKQNPFIVKMST